MRLYKALLILLVSSILATNSLSTALANGGKDQSQHYMARIKLKSGGWIFIEANIERLSYILLSFQNKYKLVPIKVQNEGQSDIRLSAETDKIEVILPNGSKVRAVLDLSTSDPEVWDSLDFELRSQLAYPMVIQAGEEEVVFVFIPGGEGQELPKCFHWWIESMPERSDMGAGNKLAAVCPSSLIQAM